MLERSRPFESAPAFDEEPTSGVLRQQLPLTSVPRTVMSPAAIRGLGLDPRAAYVLWLADGRSSVSDIFDMCTIPVDEASAILASLAALGVIVIEGVSARAKTVRGPFANEG